MATSIRPTAIRTWRAIRRRAAATGASTTRRPIRSSGITTTIAAMRRRSNTRRARIISRVGFSTDSKPAIAHSTAGLVKLTFGGPPVLLPFLLMAFATFHGFSDRIGEGPGHRFQDLRTCVQGEERVLFWRRPGTHTLQH